MPLTDPAGQGPTPPPLWLTTAEQDAHRYDQEKRHGPGRAHAGRPPDRGSRVVGDRERATGDFFADVAPGWVARYATRPSFRHRLRVIAEVVGPILAARPRPAVLDFGGGPGVFSVLCARHGGFVVDLDSSAAMLLAGRRELATIESVVSATAPPAPAATTPGSVCFIAGTLDTLSPSARDRFDLVLAIAVLEYLENPHEALALLGELLSPGGTLVISVPREYSLPRRAERLLAPMVRLALRCTQAHRMRDLAYTGLRPHGDRVPWRSAATAAGLTVDTVRPLPLGQALSWSFLCPNEVVVLRRASAAQPETVTVADQARAAHAHRSDAISTPAPRRAADEPHRPPVIR